MSLAYKLFSKKDFTLLGSIATSRNSFAACKVGANVWANAFFVTLSATTVGLYNISFPNAAGANLKTIVTSASASDTYYGLAFDGVYLYLAEDLAGAGGTNIRKLDLKGTTMKLTAISFQAKNLVYMGQGKLAVHDNTNDDIVIMNTSDLSEVRRVNSVSTSPSGLTKDGSQFWAADTTLSGAINILDKDGVSKGSGTPFSGTAQCVAAHGGASILLLTA